MGDVLYFLENHRLTFYIFRKLERVNLQANQIQSNFWKKMTIAADVTFFPKQTKSETFWCDVVSEMN